MKKISICQVIVFVFCGLSFGQDIKPKIPTSPNAAQFAKYTDVPVSLSTGQVNFSVPIYTIKYADIEIPISYDYSNQGLKVEEIASSFGNGWNLNAGGVITRDILGFADESDVGFLEHRAEIGNYFSTSNQNEKKEFLYKVINGEIDSQPDLYSFNFLGYSGKFYFDNNGFIQQMPATNLVIEPIWNLSAPKNNVLTKVGLTLPGPEQLPYLSGFRIKDGHGFQYEFLFGVLSHVSFNSNYPREITPQEYFYGGANTWALTKVTSPSGRIVNFRYQENGSFEIWDSNRSMYLPSLVSPESCGDPSIVVNSQLKVVQEYLISRIEFDHGTVEFSEGQTRTDILNFDGSNSTIKTLDNIRVLNSTGQLIKKLDFMYEYFLGTNPVTGRLKLKRISEIGSDNIKGKEWAFNYYGEQSTLPNYTSYSQDHWGFYNGKGNQTLFPTGVQPSLVGYKQINTSWADRSADPSYAVMGMLSSVEYPTGGTTKFEYEANRIQYNANQSSGIPLIFRKGLSHVEPVSLISATIPSNETRTFNFTLNEPGYLSISATSTTNDLVGWLTPTINLIGPAGSPLPTALILSAKALAPGQVVYNLSCEYAGVGNYSLELSTQTWEPAFTSTFVVEAVFSKDINLYTNGLRIRRVENCTNGNCLLKTYQYSKPFFTTGVPRYHQLNRNNTLIQEGGSFSTIYCESLLVNERSLNQLGSVEYEEVSEVEGDPTAIRGKKILQYLSSAPISSLDADPYPMAIPQFWLSGKIKEIITYEWHENAFRLISSNKYTYNNSSYLEYDYISKKFLSIGQLNFNGIKTRFNLKGIGGTGLDSEYYVGLTPYYSSYFKLLSSEKSVYSYQSNTPVVLTDVMSYSYSTTPAFSNLQPIKIFTKSSSGDMIEKVMRYADDVGVYDNPVYQFAQDQLKLRNMLEIPLENSLYKNSQLIESARVSFDVINGKLVSVLTEKKTRNSSYYPEVLINKSDLMGNPLNYISNDGIPITLLWSYSNNFIVAKIIGSTFDQVLLSMGLTESEYYSLSASFEPSQLFISKIQSLRNSNFLVESYLHDPIKGLSSITDVNGKVEKYDYDNFLRLNIIRDHNNSIVKTYYYNIIKK